MIDFTNSFEELNNYKGSEKKKTLIYNNKKYLVKFPDPIREKNKDISYINNAFSEYVGSNIFRIIGFKTQNTILGKYKYNEKEKIVCACEDFTDDNHTLYEFENLALSTNPDKKIDTELSDIMDVIIENRMLNNDEVSKKLEFEIKPIIGNYVRQHEQLYNAFYHVFNDFSSHDVNVVGRTKMLEQPEFSNNVEKIKNLFNKLESEDTFSSIEEDDDNNIKVFIGEESKIDDDVTVIKTKFRNGNEEGTIAIIGPKRMEYDRVVGLLEYMRENIER